MTATEVLRRMLDERGVKWTVPDESWNQDNITYWKVGNIKWVAFESENGTLWLNCNSVTDLTPEQAIAATLGATDARPTQAESSGTCRIEEHFGEWYCTGCGDIVGTCDPDSELCVDGNYVSMWNYCPNCGRRIVDEKEDA